MTCGYLRGVQTVTSRKTEDGPDRSLDRYLKRKKKELQKEASADISEKVVKIESYTDFLNILKSKELNESLVSRLTNGLCGWPNFDEVFAVSALEARGIEELKSYIFAQAKEGHWLYHPQIRSNLSPPDLVIEVVKSKFLEVLSGALPYKIKPEIASWVVENEVVRINIQVQTKQPDILLQNRGYDLRLVGKLAEKDLQDFFGREVFLLISLHSTKKENKKKTGKNVLH